VQRRRERGARAQIEDNHHHDKLGQTSGSAPQSGLRKKVPITNLESQLTGMAQHDGRDFTSFGLELLQNTEHEDCGLAHTRFGLTQDVHAQDRVWDALVLDCGEQERKRPWRKRQQRSFVIQLRVIRGSPTRASITMSARGLMKARSTDCVQQRAVCWAALKREDSGLTSCQADL
jgi:hypothetical protein